MNAPIVPKTRMKVDEFLAWADSQARGRYELVDGAIVAMSPERARHNLVKFAAARALRDAVLAAKLPCTVFTDGVAVVIDDQNTREPDASVQCGVDVDLDSMTLEVPMIVVEVASPSSERVDTETKLVDYFSVASVCHYLVILPEQRVVVHHRRDDGGKIETRIVRDGNIALTPPGMAVPVAALLGPTIVGGQEVHS
jgi:Uma2 family endonuclease